MTRSAVRALVLVGTALCFGVAAARALSIPLSSDIALQLHIADVLARGGAFGRDVIEINPPLAAWLEVPVVLAAAGLGVRAALAHEVAVCLLGLLSVGLLLLVGERVEALRSPARLTLFGLSAALAMALQAGLEVGQREQLAIMLTLPHFVLLAARAEGGEVPWRRAVLVGIAAGVGFALKPFFLLPLLLGELLLVRRREPGVALRRPELYAMIAVFAAYALAVLLGARGWLVSARTFWPLYGTYRPATLDDILTRQGMVIAIALVALLAWALSRRAAAGRSQLANALAMGLAGFLVAMLTQRKPWIYLAIPSGVLSLLLLVSTVLESAGRVHGRAGRLARAALVLFTALRTARYVWWLVHPPTLSLTDRTALADYTSLRTVLDSLPPGTTYASLSPTHGVTFPLVQDVHGRWTMRLPSLWPAMSGAAQDSGTQGRLRRIVAEDLLQHRPEIILVLVPGATYAWLGAPARRDWIGWLAQVPEGREALSPYGRWRNLGEYVLLRRRRTTSSNAIPDTAMPTPCAGGSLRVMRSARVPTGASTSSSPPLLRPGSSRPVASTTRTKS
jgi:hypothetical protein